jgi:hypothetical protein
MKKIVYLLLITILINYKDTLNNPFRPGVDNPYEVGKKNPLTDAELAEQLQNEEYEKAAKEKLNSEIGKLEKLIAKYKKNYEDYVASNEAVQNILNLFPLSQKGSIEKELTLLWSFTLIDSNEKSIYKKLIDDCIESKEYDIKPKIEEEQKKYAHLSEYLNGKKQRSLRIALIILHCNKQIKIAVSPIAQGINPGSQGAMAAMVENGLINTDKQGKEVVHMLYFFTKEYIGELEARLKTIGNL